MFTVTQRYSRVWSMRIASLLLGCFALPLNAAAQNAIPAQFIAKRFTEGFGRAPDQSGWSNYVGAFQANGCGATQLGNVGQQIYNLSEFDNDYPDNEAKVITLYRGALNRDVDQGALQDKVAQLNSGTAWSDVVAGVFASDEFVGNVGAYCSTDTPNTHFGNTPPPTPTPGGDGFSGSEGDLQALLNSSGSGSTVCLAQKALIVLDAPLTVPGGVTLTTCGSPGPTSYALMARLARGSSFSGPNVIVNGGGAVTSVWVDGQRNVLGYFKPAGGDDDNANVDTRGGSGTVVANNKLSDPQGGTDFFSSGANFGNPCGSLSSPAISSPPTAQTTASRTTPTA